MEVMTFQKTLLDEDMKLESTTYSIFLCQRLTIGDSMTIVRTHVSKLHVEEEMQIPSFTKKQSIIYLGNMSNRDIQVFSEIIWLGLELAEMRMLQDKALRGETVVVCDSNNIIKHIPAQQVIDDHEIFQQVDTEKTEEQNNESTNGNRP